LEKKLITPGWHSGNRGGWRRGTFSPAEYPVISDNLFRYFTYLEDIKQAPWSKLKFIDECHVVRRKLNWLDNNIMICINKN